MEILLFLSLPLLATVRMAFPVNADGTLGKGRVFEDVTAMAKDHPGVPDGMKVDHQVNPFASGPAGIHVYSADGKRLSRIRAKTKGKGW